MCVLLPAALPCIHTSEAGTTPSPWVAQHRKIVDPESGETLDNGIVLFFKGMSCLVYLYRTPTTRDSLAPKSFTTEDTLELQVHSGRAVLASILAALSKLPFCRPADPGEFTQRAFEGGRMDLTQVESLKDLINAETEVQRRVALRGLGVSRFPPFHHSVLFDAVEWLGHTESKIRGPESQDIGLSHVCRGFYRFRRGHR